MEREFVIMIGKQYYAGESEIPSTKAKTSGSGWYLTPVETNQIKLVDVFEEAKLIDCLSNLNSHWKRIYEAFRYGELKPDNVKFLELQGGVLPSYKPSVLEEQLDISQYLHKKEFDKVRRYEKALCAILNIVAEQGQDGLIDIITDALNGHELMSQYEADALEGTNLLAQNLDD